MQDLYVQPAEIVDIVFMHRKPQEWVETIPVHSGKERFYPHQITAPVGVVLQVKDTDA